MTATHTKTVKLPIAQWKRLKIIREKFGLSFYKQVQIALGHYLVVMEKIISGIDEGDEYTKKLMDNFSDKYV